MSDSPAAIIFDEQGSPILTVSGTTTSGAVRLGVDATLAPGQSVSTIGVPVVASNIVRQKCKNGGSPDLLVDGSGSDIEFMFDADPTDHLAIQEIRFVFVAEALKTEGDKFGDKDDLSNGVLLEIRSGGVTTELANIQTTEDFLSFYSPGGITFEQNGSKDFLVAGFYLGGAIQLKAGTSDFVKVTIRDDLSDLSFKHFTCTVYAIKVEV